MAVIISDEVLHASRMTEDELLHEVAVLLYQQQKLSLGQASQLAHMSRMQFQHLLASRQIAIHYDIVDLETDLKTLQALRPS